MRKLNIEGGLSLRYGHASFDLSDKFKSALSLVTGSARSHTLDECISKACGVDSYVSEMRFTCRAMRRCYERTGTIKMYVNG